MHIGQLVTVLRIGKRVDRRDLTDNEIFDASFSILSVDLILLRFGLESSTLPSLCMARTPSASNVPCISQMPCTAVLLS